MKKDSQKFYLYDIAKLLQLCPTLCDPIDSSPPGFPVSGILQARTLEWVAISFSNAWKWKVKVKSLSHVRLIATPWTAAHQAPLSMGFSRQEYWSGVPLPSLLYVIRGKHKFTLYHLDIKRLWCYIITYNNVSFIVHFSFIWHYLDLRYFNIWCISMPHPGFAKKRPVE